MNSTHHLAGRIRRLFATLIDFILVPSLTLLLVMITGVVEHAEDYQDNWWILHVFVLAVLSYLLLNGYGLWKRGQTLGKRVLGIAIVPESGAPDGAISATPAPLWKLICIRALFFPLLYLALVAVVIPWLALVPLLDLAPGLGKRKRTLHDLACGTVVIRRTAEAAETA